MKNLKVPENIIKCLNYKKILKTKKYFGKFLKVKKSEKIDKIPGNPNKIPKSPKTDQKLQKCK